MASEIDAGALQTVGEALRARPRVLLLGQSYQAGPSGDDPLSTAFRTRYPGVQTAHAWWLSDTADLGRRAAIFGDVERALLVTDELRICLRLAWSVVFTSAIGSLPRTPAPVNKNETVGSRD